jgi:hypothetical protein
VNDVHALEGRLLTHQDVLDGGGLATVRGSKEHPTEGVREIEHVI